MFMIDIKDYEEYILRSITLTKAWEPFSEAAAIDDLYLVKHAF